MKAKKMSFLEIGISFLCLCLLVSVVCLTNNAKEKSNKVSYENAKTLPVMDGYTYHTDSEKGVSFIAMNE